MAGVGDVRVSLNPSEGRLLALAKPGADAVFRANTGESQSDEPQSSDDQVIRAELLAELCARPREQAPRRLTINGARIIGELDLSWLTVHTTLRFVKCRIEHPMNLQDSSLKSLDLVECRIAAIYARRMNTQGDFRVIKSVVDTMLMIRQASIGGDFLVGESVLNGEDALNASLSAIRGDIRVIETRMEGLVNLRQATVGGDVIVNDSRFTSSARRALVADGAAVGGRLRLDGSRFDGSVHLPHLRTGGDLTFDRSTIHARDAKHPSIDLASATAGPLTIESCELYGALLIHNGTFSSVLIADSSITAEHNAAVQAAHSTVASSFTIDNCPKLEAIDLSGATVGGTASLTGVSPETSLDLKNADIASLDSPIKVPKVHSGGKNEPRAARYLALPNLVALASTIVIALASAAGIYTLSFLALKGKAIAEWTIISTAVVVSPFIVTLIAAAIAQGWSRSQWPTKRALARSTRLAITSGITVDLDPIPQDSNLVNYQGYVSLILPGDGAESGVGRNGEPPLSGQGRSVYVAIGALPLGNRFFDVRVAGGIERPTVEFFVELRIEDEAGSFVFTERQRLTTREDGSPAIVTFRPPTLTADEAAFRAIIELTQGNRVVRAITVGAAALAEEA